MKKLKPILAIILFIIYGPLAITVVIPLIATALLCKFVFGKRSYRTRNYQTVQNYPNLQEYPVKFKSGKNMLSGYFLVDKNIPKEEYKAVLLTAHGIGCSRANYLNRYNYFAKKGYIVFAYDATGTCESEGKGIKGLPQSQVDMANAIEYLSSIEQIQDYKLLVYGHSWGGYASATMLNRDCADKVTACATLSGFNDVWGIMRYQVVKRASKVALLMKPWVFLHYFLMYGKAGIYTGMKGINKYKGPVLVMHSKDDKTVNFSSSVAIHQKECTNPKAEFIILEDRGHTISRSVEAERLIMQSFKAHNGTSLKQGKSNIFQYNVDLNYEYADDKWVFDLEESFMDRVNEFFEKALAEAQQ